MQLFWGRYPLSVNGCEVTNRTEAVLSDFGQPVRYKTAYDVLAYIDGSGQAALSAAELKFRANLAVPYQDFKFYCDDGSLSSMSLASAATMTGLKVTNISFEEAQGGEFVNRRTAKFTVEGEYLIISARFAVISFQESLSIVGNGGPRRRWRFPMNAAAIRQVVSRGSLVRATQSGKMVGHTTRPVRPRPIFPLYVVNEADTSGFESAKQIGRALIDWPVSWTYTFERGDGPLIGFPNQAPGVA
jgi:hypothetical protein